MTRLAILLAAIAAIAYILSPYWWPVSVKRGSFWRDSEPVETV